MGPLQRYTLEEAKELVRQLEPLMDDVRLVDPTETVILTMHNGELTQGEPCYHTWRREQRCDNCTSMQAIVESTRTSKYQIVGDDARYMISWPILLAEGDREEKVVLEAIMRASDLLLEQEGGAKAMKQQLKETRERLHTDDLTKVYNRRYLNEFEFLYRKQNKVPEKVGLILLDLRKFKEVNDTRGHTVGDRILQQVGQALQDHVREKDSVIRYGGDEFVVILTDCGPEVLPRKIEELRQAVAPVIEANFGYAHTEHFRIEPDFLKDMIHEADAMMYAEKRAAGGGR